MLHSMTVSDAWNITILFVKCSLSISPLIPQQVPVIHVLELERPMLWNQGF